MNWSQITDAGVMSLISERVSKTIEEIHIAHCEKIGDESIECILLRSKRIKYLLYHGCPNITGTVIILTGDGVFIVD